MATRPSNVTAAASAAICLVSASLWVASHTARPAIEHLGWERRGVVLSQGSVQVYRLGRFAIKQVGQRTIMGRAVAVISPGQPIAYTLPS